MKILFLRLIEKIFPRDYLIYACNENDYHYGPGKEQQKSITAAMLKAKQYMHYDKVVIKVFRRRKIVEIGEVVVKGGK